MEVSLPCRGRGSGLVGVEPRLSAARRDADGRGLPGTEPGGTPVRGRVFSRPIGTARPLAVQKTRNSGALGLGSNGEYETEGGAVKIGTRRTLRYPLGDQMAPLLVDKHVCAMSYIGSRNSKACKGGHWRATNHPIAATTDL